MTKSSSKGFEKYGLAVRRAINPINEETFGEENKERFLKVIENVFFDKLGDRYLGMVPTSKESSLLKILHGFAEIDSAFEVLKDVVFYIKRFPSKRPQISKTRFLKYHIGNYFNEVYILRERLRSYQKIVIRMYKNNHRPQETSKLVKMLDTLISGFDNIVSARGKHVHQERYDDEDFNRLLLYENFEPDDPKFNRLYPLALQVYRKKWTQIITLNNKEIKRILDIYFEILYSIVFDENENWIKPLKANNS